MKHDQKITETQTKAILKHFENGGSLTSLNARRLYGTVALNSRVSDLRNKQGIEVKDEWISVKTRYGWKRVKKYFI